jgi:hypothetical protein
VNPTCGRFAISRRWVLVVCVLLAAVAQCSVQGAAQERAFPQSKAAIEKALSTMQASLSGRLPTLEGFAVPGDRPLDRFKRGYYQCEVQVKSTASGGSVVRVAAKVTAWYADPDASGSGYRTLASNGRLEGDLLNQLEDVLATRASAATNIPTTAPSQDAARPPKTRLGDREPTIDAPLPNLPKTADPLAARWSHMAKEKSQTIAPPKQQADQRASDLHVEQLRKELKNLQEILNNQSHPNNLVAVKKSATPVLAAARLDAKVLFYTTVEDEFEILDMTSDWVHVRISGLARGWIRRSSLEMPDLEIDARASQLEMFHVTREETAPFSGDWDPLRGKTVKIISVQKTDEKAQDTPQAKLDYATSLLGDKYKELAQTSPAVAGVMLIFDSADGGMMAATLPALQQWKAGRLSNDDLWRQCYFDPPDTFAMTANR